MLEQLHSQHENDEPVDLAAPVDDPMLARRLLIELAVNERKQSQLEATKAAIFAEYQSRINALADRQAAIRESLQIYAERNGHGESFPDVGSFHVQQRGPSVKIVEPEAFAAWLIKNGQAHQVSVDQKYTFGTTAKKSAVAAIREGEVAPGCEPVAPSASLVVKGVK